MSLVQRTETSSMPTSGFTRSHPRFDLARRRVHRHLGVAAGPLSAKAIASYLADSGGVPEFVVRNKDLPNRMVSFGLVKVVHVATGERRWWLPFRPLPSGYEQA